MYIGNQHKIVYFTLIKKVYTNIASLHWELKVALYKQHLELNTCRSCSLGPGERHLGGKQAANGQWAARTPPRRNQKDLPRPWAVFSAKPAILFGGGGWKEALFFEGLVRLVFLSLKMF